MPGALALVRGSLHEFAEQLAGVVPIDPTAPCIPATFLGRQPY